MAIWDALRTAFTGENMLTTWLVLFLASGLVAGVVSGFFKARKIQPRGFKWKIFGFEAAMAVVSIAISGTVIGGIQIWLKAHGYIALNEGPAAWWVIALEYIAYFLA